MSIKKALEEIPVRIEELIKDWSKDLDEAWLKKESEEELKITFGASLGVNKLGKNECEVSISFTKEKVRDSTKFSWDDKQEKLPLKEKGDKK